MITKGEIQSIDLLSNTCTVRLPAFESVENVIICTTATFSGIPGNYNGYAVGDIVYVGFEQNSLTNAIILGKLYLGIDKEQQNRGAISADTLNIKSSAILPGDTKISYVTPNNTISTDSSAAKYTSIKDIIDKTTAVQSSVDKASDYLNNAITSTSQDLANYKDANGKKITGIMGSIDEITGDVAVLYTTTDSINTEVSNTKGQISTLEQTATKIEATVKENDTQVRSLISAVEAKITAEKGNKTWHQAEAPQDANEGDLWWDTTNNKLWRYNGKTWDPQQDSDLDDLNYKYSELKITADGIKSEVTNIDTKLENNYLTASQTQSSIDQAADRITHTVSQTTYSNLLSQATKPDYASREDGTIWYVKEEDNIKYTPNFAYVPKYIDLEENVITWTEFINPNQIPANINGKNTYSICKILLVDELPDISSNPSVTANVYGKKDTTTDTLEYYWYNNAIWTKLVASDTETDYIASVLEPTDITLWKNKPKAEYQELPIWLACTENTLQLARDGFEPLNYYKWDSQESKWNLIDSESFVTKSIIDQKTDNIIAEVSHGGDEKFGWDLTSKHFNVYNETGNILETNANGLTIHGKIESKDLVNTIDKVSLPQIDAYTDLITGFEGYNGVLFTCSKNTSGYIDTLGSITIQNQDNQQDLMAPKWTNKTAENLAQKFTEWCETKQYSANFGYLKRPSLSDDGVFETETELNVIGSWNPITLKTEKISKARLANSAYEEYFVLDDNAITNLPLPIGDMYVTLEFAPKVPEDLCFDYNITYYGKWEEYNKNIPFESLIVDTIKTKLHYKWKKETKLFDTNGNDVGELSNFSIQAGKSCVCTANIKSLSINSNTLKLSYIYSIKLTNAYRTSVAAETYDFLYTADISDTVDINSLLCHLSKRQLASGEGSSTNFYYTPMNIHGEFTFILRDTDKDKVYSNELSYQDTLNIAGIRNSKKLIWEALAEHLYIGNMDPKNWLLAVNKFAGIDTDGHAYFANATLEESEISMNKGSIGQLSVDNTGLSGKIINPDITESRTMLSPNGLLTSKNFNTGEKAGGSVTIFENYARFQMTDDDGNQSEISITGNEISSLEGSKLIPSTYSASQGTIITTTKARTIKIKFKDRDVSVGSLLATGGLGALIKWNFEWNAYENSSSAALLQSHTTTVTITTTNGHTFSAPVTFNKGQTGGACTIIGYGTLFSLNNFKFKQISASGFTSVNGSSELVETTITTKTTTSGSKEFILPCFNVIGGLIPDKTKKYDLGCSNSLWNTVYAKDGTINTSDRNQKNSITKLSNKYNILFDNLKPVSYKFNDNNSNRTHIGFIAQDVEKAMSIAKLDSKDFAGFVKYKNGYNIDEYGLRYSEFIALNTAQIQELKKRVEMLEQELLEYKNKE